MERLKKQYNVQLEDEVVERIDKLAEMLYLSRSQLMRNFILMGLEDGEILNRTGVLRVVKIGRDIREKFLTDVLGGKLALNQKGGWKVSK